MDESGHIFNITFKYGVTDYFFIFISLGYLTNAAF
jgi:hypothetical protein